MIRPKRNVVTVRPIELIKSVSFKILPATCEKSEKRKLTETPKHTIIKKKYEKSMPLSIHHANILRCLRLLYIENDIPFYLFFHSFNLLTEFIHV